jgi:hypothetical protein
MSFAESILILRLFSAIFLVLLGATFMFTNEASVVRFMGAFLASIGLTALYLVWLGARSR